MQESFLASLGMTAVKLAMADMKEEKHLL